MASSGRVPQVAELSVRNYIPIPVEQAVLDFHPLGEFVNESDGRMLRVLLVAASSEMVQRTASAVQQAGLSPVMIDLTPFALLRGLAQADELGLSGAEAEALVDVGASVTNIIVHQGGVARFVRILLMGGADITEAVSERIGLPIEEAEAIKQQTGMADQPGRTNPILRRLNERLKPAAPPSSRRSAAPSTTTSLSPAPST